MIAQLSAEAFASTHFTCASKHWEFRVDDFVFQSLRVAFLGGARKGRNLCDLFADKGPAFAAFEFLDRTGRRQNAGNHKLTRIIPKDFMPSVVLLYEETKT
jgi:hypothetical protein